MIRTISIHRAIFTIAVAGMAAFAAACGSDSNPGADATPTSVTTAPTLNVVTTIYPVTYFAERVGGDRVDVESLVKPGVDAHDFEPTPGDIISIREADALIYTDPSFEGWIESAIESANNDALIVVKTADLGEDHDGHDEDGHDDHDGDHDEDGHDEDDHADHEDGDHEDGDHDEDEHDADHEDGDGHDEDEDGHDHEDGDHDEDGHDEDDHADHEDGDHDEDEYDADHKDDDHGHDDDEDHDDHGHEDEDGHDHDHGGVDPHVWLNPVEATEQVRAIQAAFAAADSAGADIYRANADALVAELLDLDREFGAALGSCTLDHMVVSHEAYGHLAERYGLEQIGLADLSAEFESTPRRVAEIIKEMERLGISHILQEPILSDDLAETVASETSAEILPLHPLEALTPEEADAGDTYFTVMRRNLTSLKTALGCG